MARIVVAGDGDVVDRIVDRLRKADPGAEELTFAFGRFIQSADGGAFECFMDRPVWPHEFAYRSQFHIELSDTARAAVVSTAERLGASLIEFHTHPYAVPACFSPSDLSGFREFVPYVWWRLRSRPYAAVVVGPDSFDGVAWLKSPEDAVPIAAIEQAGASISCTGCSRPLISEEI